MTNNDDNKYIDTEGTSLLDDELIRAGHSKKRYIRREKIGEGGQATVYKVHDKKLDAPRAMKIIHSHFSANKDFVQSYKNEVKFTSQLNHTNIVKVYEADTEEGNLYIIMDIIDGKSLAKFKSLPVSIACIAISRAADAIKYAHEAKIETPDKTSRGLIHGDIKPENMIIREDNGEVMVTDFGLSAALSSDQSATSSIPMATWAYASPELFDNAKKSVKSDIYALGVSLVKLITGKTGYDDQSIISMSKLKSKPYCEVIDCTQIPASLLSIIEKATHRDLNRRYDSIEEFKDELDCYIEDNFVINNSYTNILGAYTRYKVEPQAKLSYTAGDSGFSPPPKKPVNWKKAVPPLIIIMIIAALTFSLIRLGIFRPGRMSLVVLNEPGTKIEVLLEDEKIGEFATGQTRKVFPIPEEGMFRIVLKSTYYDDYEEYLTFSSEDRRQTIQYSPVPPELEPVTEREPPEIPDPVREPDLAPVREPDPEPVREPVREPEPVIEYTLRIENPLTIEAELFFDERQYPLPAGGRSFTFTESKQFTLNIRDKEGKYTDHSETVSFSRQRRDITVNYKPDVLERFLVEITNPANLTATVHLNGEEHMLSGDSFQRSYREQKVLNVAVKADWHEEQKFMADFNRQDTFSFAYQPEPEKGRVVINNIPDQLTIYLDGDRVSFEREDDRAMLADLPMGKRYSIKLDSPNYDTQREEMVLNTDPYNISFVSQAHTGLLRIEGISSGLARNAVLVLRGREYSLLDGINGLAAGVYENTVFSFRVNDYRKSSNPRRINIRPVTQGRTTLTLEDFGVKVITVASNRPQTRVYHGNQYVALAPVDIPIIDETLFTIRVEAGDEGDSRRINMNEITDYTVRFRFPSPETESLFEEADMYYDREDYANAERFLDQVLTIDQLHEEALIMRMDIVIKQIEDAYSNRQHQLFKSRLDKALDYLEDSVNGITNNFERLKILKNMGKYKYKYADEVITNNIQRINYLEKEVLATLKHALVKGRRSNMAGLQYYHYDETECYLAMTYQRLYELTESDEYKRHAMGVWGRNRFDDFTGLSIREGTQTNPFRAVKEEWSSRLR